MQHTLSAFRVIIICSMLAACIITASLASAAEPAQASGLLPLNGYRASTPDDSNANAAGLWQQWKVVKKRYKPEKAFGANAFANVPPVRKQWKTLVAKMPSWSPTEKLRNINGFFNNRTQCSDISTYGVEEYWATPSEFLEKGGDCEDFSIAKYLALQYLGWPKNSMWLLFVYDPHKKSNHTVLAARRPDGTIFILDNLSRPAHLLIPVDTYLKRYKPLFAIGENGLRMYTSESSGKISAKSATIGKKTQKANKKEK